MICSAREWYFTSTLGIDCSCTEVTSDYCLDYNCTAEVMNSLPNDKFLKCSKLKAFADNKLNLAKKLKFVLGRVENMWKKERMLVTSIFSFSHIVFKRLLI